MHAEHTMMTTTAKLYILTFFELQQRLVQGLPPALQCLRSQHVPGSDRIGLVSSPAAAVLRG